MKYLVFLVLFCASCALPSKYFSDPRTDLAPLSADTDRLLTDAESHTESAMVLTGAGFGLACLGFSPLAPIALAYASIPLFVGGGVESGSAVALEREAKFVSARETTASGALSH